MPKIIKTEEGITYERHFVTTVISSPANGGFRLQANAVQVARNEATGYMLGEIPLGQIDCYTHDLINDTGFPIVAGALRKFLNDKFDEKEARDAQRDTPPPVVPTAPEPPAED